MRCTMCFGFNELLERRLLFASYGPDVSFGDGGSVPAYAQDVIAPQSDGRIYTVGSYATNGGGSDEESIYHTAASRINADGTVDTSFGQDGTAQFGELVGQAFYDGT